jgi:hypothetical protein
MICRGVEGWREWKTSGEVLLLVAGSHGDVVWLVRGVVAYARSLLRATARFAGTGSTSDAFLPMAAVDDSGCARTREEIGKRATRQSLGEPPWVLSPARSRVLLCELA